MMPCVLLTLPSGFHGVIDGAVFLALKGCFGLDEEVSGLFEIGWMTDSVRQSYMKSSIALQTG